MPMSIKGPKGDTGPAGGGGAAIDVAVLLTRDYALNAPELIDMDAMTLNTEHPMFAGPNSYLSWAPGDVALIEDNLADPTGNGGVWVLGALTDPAAVPLTRHPDYPDASSPIAKGTRFRVLRAYPQQLSWRFSAADTDTGGDTIKATFVDSIFAVPEGTPVVLFKHPGGTLPAGLVVGQTYFVLAQVINYTRPQTNYNLTFQLTEDYSTFPPVPVDLTSAGVDDGDTSAIGAAAFLLYGQTDGGAQSNITITGAEVIAGTLSGNDYTRADAGPLGIAASTPGGNVSGAGGHETFADGSGIAQGDNSQTASAGLSVGVNTRAIAAGVALGAGAFANRNAGAIGQYAQALAEGSFAAANGITHNVGEICIGGVYPFGGSAYGVQRYRAIMFNGAPIDATPIRMRAAGIPVKDAPLELGAYLQPGTAFVFNGWAVAVNGASGTDMAAWKVEGVVTIDTSGGGHQCLATVTRVAHTAGDAEAYELEIDVNATDLRLDVIATGVAGVLFDCLLQGQTLETGDYWGLSFPALVAG